jgi:hypothetical protein
MDQAAAFACMAALIDGPWDDAPGTLEHLAEILAEHRRGPADAATAKVDALSDDDLGMLACDIADVIDRTAPDLDISQDGIEPVLLPFLAAAIRAEPEDQS